MQQIVPTPSRGASQDEHYVDSLPALLALLRGTAGTSVPKPGGIVSYKSLLTELGDVFSVEEALKHSIFVHTLRLQGL